MSTPDKPSSERPNVKVTYNRRRKNKSEGGHSSGEEDTSQVHDAGNADGVVNDEPDEGNRGEPERSLNEAKGKEGSFRGKDKTSEPSASRSKPPSSRGPKKVDIRLPGPTPPRARPDEGSQQSAKKKLQRNSSSSLRSRSQLQVLQNGMNSALSTKPLSASKKPPSTTKESAAMKPPSSVRATTPEESDAEDDASIASISSSVISTSKIRRTEAQRIQYFENDPDAGEIEPYRIFCKRCGQHVNLGRKQTYTIRPWEKHRTRCDQQPRKTPLDPNADVANPNGSGPDQSLNSPARDTAPPPSTVSTDSSTLVPTDSSPARTSRKRQRADSTSIPPPNQDQQQDSDVRPQNRPRTETYAEPEEEPPSTLGWFLLPFRTFMRGFRDSLSRDEEEATQ
ncbi:hypothetical protein AX16_004689 [Volvariella volvacea WC 439]|nr:hypothetical protein AX16_004689 [Volvariella volvacea WC 439]